MMRVKQRAKQSLRLALALLVIDRALEIVETPDGNMTVIIDGDGMRKDVNTVLKTVKGTSNDAIEWGFESGEALVNKANKIGEDLKNLLPYMSEEDRKMIDDTLKNAQNEGIEGKDPDSDTGKERAQDTGSHNMY